MKIAENQKEKVRRFMNDTTMNETIYNVLLTSFLKKNTTFDVHTLAASRLAVDFLADGWKELSKISQEGESVDKQVVTPHV